MKVDQDILIHFVKNVFEYLTQYGSKKNPSSDGLHCYEAIVKRGEVSHGLWKDEGYEKEYVLKKIIQYGDNGRVIQMLVEVRVGLKEVPLLTQAWEKEMSGYPEIFKRKHDSSLFVNHTHSRKQGKKKINKNIDTD
jgi:hypothetical protein